MSLPHNNSFDKDGSSSLSKDKEKEPKPDTQIRINVKGLDGTILQFKIRKHVALGKLMKNYCERKNLAPENIRFFFDQTRIQKDFTPIGMGIEDDDTLDIVQKQDGGGEDGPCSSEASEGGTPINVYVQGIDNQFLEFTIKKGMALSKLMKTYCKKMDLVLENTRFLFDGKQVQSSCTAKSLGIDHGDTIEVFTKQGAKKQNISAPTPDEKELKGAKISIRVEGMDSTFVQFNIMKHVELSKLMESYSKRLNLNKALIKFLYDGKHVLPESTPESLAMADGDTLEIYIDQLLGGGYCRRQKEGNSIS